MEREFIGVLQNFGSQGSIYGSRITVPVVSNTTVFLPAGAWLCETDANTLVKFSYDSQSTWVTWIAASTVQVVSADGFCVAFTAGSTSGTGHRTQLLAWQ